MNSKTLRQTFLDFFSSRGHTVKLSSSLVPANDPTVLFTSAGMQQFAPYFLGEAVAPEKRYTSIQKCFRTSDIEEVGDHTHLTFFEMLGNFSIGDYFKREAITWSYELLTSKDGFALDPQRLYVTCFAGDENAPQDEEAATIWRELFARDGVTGERVYFLGADSNWWPAVKKNEDTWTGPTGPSSEMFYDVTGTLNKGMTFDEYKAADDAQKVVEVWNDVFMEYRKEDGKIVDKLANKNIDTGSGLERMAMVLQGKDNIFDTDLFVPIIATIAEVTGKPYTGNERNFRIIADHVRSATFLAAENVEPGKEGRAYIARRIIRRAVMAGRRLGVTEPFLDRIVDTIVHNYADFYPELRDREAAIKFILQQEEKKFLQTLAAGLREFEKRTKNVTEKILPGDLVFKLFDTYGFPKEMTKELADESGFSIDEKGFDAAFAKHREASRVGVRDQFERKGGGQGDKVKTAHTATHMLHAALHKILGDQATQAGSQLGDGEFRFDFRWPTKLTDEQKKQIEELVNAKIAAGLSVTKEDMTVEEAKKAGAMGIFDEKYGNTVSVYTVHDGDGYFSKEICGGPHVSNTKEIKFFKIVKEKSSSAGIRRIKAQVGKVE